MVVALGLLRREFRPTGPMTRDPASYLAAIIDGEGTVDLSGSNRRVVIYNTDPLLVDVICSCLDELGIAYVCSLYDRRNTPRHRACYRIVIGRREALERLGGLPLAPRKREKLDRLIGLFRPPVPEAEVVAKYLEGRTAANIAQEYDCSETLIFNRLRRAGVERRKGGP